MDPYDGPERGDTELYFFGSLVALGVWIVSSFVADDGSTIEFVGQLVGVAGSIGMAVAIHLWGRTRGWWR